MVYLQIFTLAIPFTNPDTETCPESSSSNILSPLSSAGVAVFFRSISRLLRFLRLRRMKSIQPAINAKAEIVPTTLPTMGPVALWEGFEDEVADFVQEEVEDRVAEPVEEEIIAEWY